tara:strand:+ start:13653 stop:13994 length:342 start_codon:yes stop_codon:yes gene_type:complete
MAGAYIVDKAKILENFKKTITLVRGKKYTFKVSGVEEDGTMHPFYLTSSITGGAGFPGVITENVEHSYERNKDPYFTTDDTSVITKTGFTYDAVSDHYEVNLAGSYEKSLRFR